MKNNICNDGGQEIPFARKVKMRLNDKYEKKNK